MHLSNFLPISERSRSRSRSRSASRASEREDESSDVDLDFTEEQHSGLFVLHEIPSIEKHAVDIVAVHGLGGDYKKTWTGAHDKLWLQDFLPGQLRQGGIEARIMSYGYNSGTAFSKSVADIDDTAADLLNRLNDERISDEEQERPIIFVAHSLGGIVVKKVMILAHERSSRYGHLLENTSAAVFLGVPHRGSDLAYWADFAARLLQFGQLGFRGNPTFVAALQRNTPTFQNISAQFVERAASLSIRTFYETERMGNQLIVDKDSAMLRLPNEMALPIVDSDHRVMCKFDLAGEQKYKPVWSAILREARTALARQTKHPRPVTPEPPVHSTPELLPAVPAVSVDDLEVNHRSPDGSTRLHHCAQVDDLENARFLISKGAKLEVTDNYERTPLYYALQTNARSVAQFLIDRGAKVLSLINDILSELQSPSATDFNSSRSVLKTAATLRLPNSAVYRVIRKGRDGSAQHDVFELLEAGFNPDERGPSGFTPLHYAAHTHQISVVKMLLDRGANIELQTPVDGQRHQDEPGQGTIRALHIAAGKGDMEMIRLLLNHKGDPNASDISGANSLQCVAIYGPEVAALLLEAGADIHNAKNDFCQHPGWQILHWAVLCGNLPLVKFLVEKGADVNATTRAGQTPRMIAKEQGRPKIGAYLGDAEASAATRAMNNMSIQA